MKKFTFKNPFEVTENDTLGSALLKGIAEGYIKGVAAGGLGLGVLAGIGYYAHKRELNKRGKEEQSGKVVDIAKAK